MSCTKSHHHISYVKLPAINTGVLNETYCKDFNCEIINAVCFHSYILIRTATLM